MFTGSFLRFPKVHYWQIGVISWKDSRLCGIHAVSSGCLAHTEKWSVSASGGILKKLPVLWTSVKSSCYPYQHWSCQSAAASKDTIQLFGTLSWGVLFLLRETEVCLVREDKRSRLRTSSSSSFYWAVFRTRKLFPHSADNSYLI